MVQIRGSLFKKRLRGFVALCLTLFMLIGLFPVCALASGFTQMLPVASWQFNSPYGVAVDGSGNMYIADFGDDCIYKIAPGGTFSKWGSTGSADGQFHNPRGIVLDSSGNVYVADTNNNRIQKFDANGTFLTKWGIPGTNDDQFDRPYGIAVDGSGNVYVADCYNNRIQKFDSSGVFLTKWGTSGTGDGQFNHPSGITVDSGGMVYVTDSGNKRIQTFDGSGTFLTKWGSSGSGNGQFLNPNGIAIDSSGNIYVSDTDNHRIQKFDFSGAFLTKWGNRGSGKGQFSYPQGVFVDSSGNLYVADTNNSRIQKFDASGTFLAKWGNNGIEDGEFNNPEGIALNSGNLYVVDTNNRRIQKFDASGAFLAKWGTVGTGDGQFLSPSRITFDSIGNSYVADSSRNCIEKFDANGVFLMKWGTTGTGDGQFQYPYDVAVDSNDNIYVVDSNNYRIQKFDTNGIFISKWGSYGTGDGQFRDPRGIAADNSNTLFIVDMTNNRIQRFDSNGVFLSKWGSYGSGDGEFYNPCGITLDSRGNIYTTEITGNRIQKFDATGTFLKKWGSPGDEQGQFFSPSGIAVDSSGNVYAADSYNHRIQKLSAHTVSYLPGAHGSLSGSASEGVYSGDCPTAVPTVTPETGYNFAYWSSDGGTTQLTPAQLAAQTISGNIAYTAYYNPVTSGGSGGSSGSSGSSGGTPTPPKASPTFTAIIAKPGAKTITQVVTFDSNTGRMTINLGDLQGNPMIDETPVTVTAPSIPGGTAYSLGIPVAYLSLPNGKGTLIFNSDAGSFSVPANMLEGIAGLEGKNVEITISLGNTSGLSESTKAAIGDRPLIQLTLTAEGKSIPWNNPNAPVRISIPYKPTAEELAHPENIVIWYVDGSGRVVSVPNGHYDATTGTVSFTTTHFSNYAVGYNPVRFTDVPENAWYGKAVNFLSARKVVTGDDSGRFNPDAKLKRGEFVVMLMKAYDLAPDTDMKDNFSDAGNTYYTGYLAAAKRLRLSAGLGDNRFQPDKEVTRQELFTLLYKALKATGNLPSLNQSESLNHFSDTSKIAPWAKEAISLFANADVLHGNNGNLAPTEATTRAEMAHLLYQLLGNPSKPDLIH